MRAGNRRGFAEGPVRGFFDNAYRLRDGCWIEPVEIESGRAPLNQEARPAGGQHIVGIARCQPDDSGAVMDKYIALDHAQCELFDIGDAFEVPNLVSIYLQ